MDTRDKILKAAAMVYAETGFRGATTRRIAQEAGVNEITLFRHFGSKGRLLHEAIECAAIGTVAMGLPEIPHDPRTELLQWARAHIAGLRDQRSLIRTCMGEIEEHPDMIAAEGSAPARAAQALSRYLARLCEHGLARHEFDSATAATVLMGVLFADAMGRDIMPDMFSNDPDSAVRAYVDLFLRAIGVEQKVSHP